jgi:hypothetical protein
MENLFRQLQQAKNDAPDNRKFACNFLTLHLIKVQFALNKFRGCERFFQVFEKNKSEGISLDLLPKSW